MSDHGGSCEQEDLHDYDQALSIGSIFIVLVASLLGTLLPMVLKRWPRFTQPNQSVNQSVDDCPFIVTIGKHIGTGVLLALGFIHLLVPAFEQLGSECLPESWLEYPYAPLFAMLAVLMMHLIETAVLEYTVFNAPSCGHTPKNDYGSVVEITDIDHTNKQTTIAMDNESIIQSPASTTKLAGNESKLASNELSPSSVVISIDKPVNHAHHHGHAHGVLLGNKAERTIQAYLLEFGLTSHSIIVGITLGVAPGHDLTSLIPALSFHQFFEGFALGARLVELEFSGWNEMLLTAIYSLSAPLGIAIGIGIAHSYHSGSVTALLVQGIFDSISAGIILYVAFVHMLANEFSTDYKNCGYNRLKKGALFAGLYGGAAVMAIIGLWL